MHSSETQPAIDLLENLGPEEHQAAVQCKQSCMRSVDSWQEPLVTAHQRLAHGRWHTSSKLCRAHAHAPRMIVDVQSPDALARSAVARRSRNQWRPGPPIPKRSRCRSEHCSEPFALTIGYEQTATALFETLYTHIRFAGLPLQ